MLKHKLRDTLDYSLAGPMGLMGVMGLIGPITPISPMKRISYPRSKPGPRCRLGASCVDYIFTGCGCHAGWLGR